MKNYQITEWCHHFIKQQVQPGDICIDATMGNGHDTELLCRLAGADGKVFAFDILPEALEHTKKRLENAEITSNYTLILDSHENMNDYVQTDSANCITFNFGYLPGGDHNKCTHAASSLSAIRTGLTLLKKNGIMSLCIYSGGDSGFEERDAILAYLHTLDSKKYLVIRSDYMNRPNNPPIPVLIVRLT